MAATRDSARSEHPGPPRVSTKIEPQELLISIFAGLGAPPQPVKTAPLADLLTLFGFTIGAARVAVKRFASRDLMERTREGRYWYAVPSPRLRELIVLGDRRIAELTTVPRWNGTWTVAWNSLPDEARRERHRLSRRLRFLGFGPLEDNVWIGPGDLADEIADFARGLEMGEHVTLLVGARPAGSIDAVVARAWDLGELRDRYQDFVDEFAPQVGHGLSGDRAFVAAVRAMNTFRRLPYLDPLLPDELFPVAAARERACRVFHELRDELLDDARAYFAQTVT